MRRFLTSAGVALAILSSPAFAASQAPAALNSSGQPVGSAPVFQVDQLGNTAPGSTGPVAPTASAAVASSSILKAGPGALLRLAVVSGASAGFVLVTDTLTAPADGAVTPKICRPIAANSSVDLNYSQVPAKFLVGITAIFSTTGCFTKTASATAMFEGYTQ